MTHEGIAHEGKAQFFCFAEALTWWFNVAKVFPFMSSLRFYTAETTATASVVSKTTEICFRTKAIWIVQKKRSILKRQRRELHSAEGNNTRRLPCENCGVSWPVRNTTRYETRRRHSVQTETLKTEGQRRKVRKGTAAGVVGGIWLAWCMTAQCQARREFGWREQRVAARRGDREDIESIKTRPKDILVGNVRALYSWHPRVSLHLKGRHECSPRVTFRCS